MKKNHSTQSNTNNQSNSRPRIQRRLVVRDGNICFDAMSEEEIVRVNEEEHRQQQIVGAMIFSNHPTNAALRNASHQTLQYYGVLPRAHHISESESNSELSDQEESETTPVDESIIERPVIQIALQLGISQGLESNQRQRSNALVNTDLRPEPPAPN